MEWSERSCNVLETGTIKMMYNFDGEEERGSGLKGIMDTG